MHRAPWSCTPRGLLGVGYEAMRELADGEVYRFFIDYVVPLRSYGKVFYVICQWQMKYYTSDFVPVGGGNSGCRHRSRWALFVTACVAFSLGRSKETVDGRSASASSRRTTGHH